MLFYMKTPAFSARRIYNFYNFCFQTKMPLDSGRKKDHIWLKVDTIENDKNKCVCRGCDQIISKKIERVKVHMEKCRSRPKSTEDQDDASGRQPRPEQCPPI